MARLNVDGGRGKKGKGHKRSRNGGAYRLEDDVFNPVGIFAQILSCENANQDMDQREAERATEEEMFEAAIAALDPELQQHSKRPKTMTLDSWKREQLFRAGATRKEASLLVRCYKTAQQLGGGILTLDRGLLHSVAARRRELASGRGIRGAEFRDFRRREQLSAFVMGMHERLGVERSAEDTTGRRFVSRPFTKQEGDGCPFYGLPQDVLMLLWKVY